MLVRWIAALAVVVIVIAGAAYGIEATSTNDFCGKTCHVMGEYYDSWFHSAHRRADVGCAECHLPEAIGPKILKKATSGTHDIYWNLIGPPDVIRATADTRAIISNNCRRCHAGLVSEIELDGRECMSCHRFTPHGGR